MNKATILQIITLLSTEYGPREWKVRESPVSVLVQTILSQNTSDKNSNRAFQSLLLSFDNWETIATTKIKDIADSIKIGGLAEVKARYIKDALTALNRQ